MSNLSRQLRRNAGDLPDSDIFKSPLNEVIIAQSLLENLPKSKEFLGGLDLESISKSMFEK